MYHQEFEPPESLRDAIKCFWYNRKDSGEDRVGFSVMPDGYAEIIFYFGSVLSVLHNGEPQALPSPFMMGLLNNPVGFFAGNRLEIIGIRCFPWTVFDLLGLPAGKDGLRIFEHPAAGLQPALAELVRAGKIAEAVEMAVQFFLQVRSGVPENSLLFRAGMAMRAANGNLPVSQVAVAAHATVRTLERNFKQSSGYSVKDVSGLIRFEQVRNRLWMAPGTGLAGLAQELGYADQSHLSREFKRYSGSSPAAFARNAKKNKQTLNGDFVAFVQA